MSISPASGTLLLPLGVKIAAMVCLLLARHGEVLLQDRVAADVYDILSSKPLMSLSLSLGSFFSLEAWQLQELQVCGVQPNTC